MSTSSESNENQFLARVNGIPLVKAFLQTVTSTYETTKNSNALIGATLEKVEGIAKLANYQAAPFKKLLDRPLDAVSKIADQQLEELQRRFPIINSTPHEILEYGQSLYERSGVKGRVEDISYVKTASVDKISETTVQCRNRLVGSVLHGQKALNHYVSSAIDVTETLVDKYVASPDGKKRSADDEPTTESYANRLRELGSKVIGGVSYRSTEAINAAKRYSTHTYTTFDNLITNTVSSAVTSVQNSLADITRIRQAVLMGVANRSREITKKSDAVAVFLVKFSLNGLAVICNRAVVMATPVLPEGLEKPAASLVSYVYHWHDRVEQANSISDIWKTATDETKNTLHELKELIHSSLKKSDDNANDYKRW